MSDFKMPDFASQADRNRYIARYCDNVVINHRGTCLASFLMDTDMLDALPDLTVTGPVKAITDKGFVFTGERVGDYGKFQLTLDASPAGAELPSWYANRLTKSEAA